MLEAKFEDVFFTRSNQKWSGDGRNISTVVQEQDITLVSLKALINTVYLDNSFSMT